MKQLSTHYRWSVKVAFYLIIIFCFIVITAQGQNGNLCYQPITGFGTQLYEIQSGSPCVNCTAFDSTELVINTYKEDYATYNSASIAAGTGISVRDTNRTYPAGYFAGYVISFSNPTLSITLLNSLTIETYNDSVLQESKTMSNGLGITLLGNASGKAYLNFPTTLAFDEVRFTYNVNVNILNNFRVYYAMAFDPQCGIPDNNSICLDQIAGPSTVAVFNAGLTNTLVSFSNIPNITDGNRNTAATLTLPAGVSLLSTPPFVGVKETEVIFPAGRKAGFVIGYSTSLLSADILNAISLQTLLHGQIQETASFNNGTGILQLSALSAGTDRKTISFTTALPFNEIRLVVSQTAAINTGSVDIYYAFESGANCSDGRTPLTAGQTSPDNGSVNAARTGTFGVLCVNQSLTGTANITNNNLSDYASYTPSLLSVGCGGEISVQNNGTDYPAGTYAGFRIGKQSGLIDAGLANAITINVYKDNNSTPVASASGPSLLDLGVLNADSGTSVIGFKPNTAFDEIQIVFNDGLVSANLGGTYQIFYAWIARDSDNDGMPDTLDVCANGNDALDTDGDGIPDDCDNCTALNGKSVFRDTDGDGIVDACDADSDDDGIADNLEDRNNDGIFENDDADGDGIANYLDLDSDNDGVTDLYESGISSSQFAGIDTDMNGVIDGGISRGNNGLANSIETSDMQSASNNYVLANTDGDNVPDFVDLDTDNDGINDIVEAANPLFADANGDGMLDGPDDDRDGINNSGDGNMVRGSSNLTASVDTDGDSVPDFRDLDSDNDLISDLVESGATNYTDADNNGVPEGADDDGDGITNGLDGNNGVFGDANQPAVNDTDNDGIPDYRDPDSDNDGTNDIAENGLGGNDLDDDGKVDNPTDPDNDGIANNNGSDTYPTNFGGLGKASALTIHVLLEGALVNPSDTLMRADLSDQGLIPVMQPYNGTNNARFMAYGGGGNEMTTITVLSQNSSTSSAIVDWIFLEFRNGTTPGTIIKTVASLLRRDGLIVGTDGRPMSVLLPAGSHYLSIKHRNHLGVMTSTALVTSGSPAIVDLKHGNTPTYGTGSQKLMTSGYYVLYGGDANSDGSVFYTAPGNDRDAILAELSGQTYNYLNTYNNKDLNIDAQTYFTAPGNDRDWLLARPLEGDELDFIQEQIP